MDIRERCQNCRQCPEHHSVALAGKEIRDGSEHKTVGGDAEPAPDFPSIVIDQHAAEVHSAIKDLQPFWQDPALLQRLLNLAGYRKHKIDLVELIPSRLARLDFLPDVRNDWNSRSNSRTQRLWHPPDVIDVKQHWAHLRDDHAEGEDRRRSLRIREKFPPRRHGGKPDLNAASPKFLRQWTWTWTDNQRMEAPAGKAVKHDQQLALRAADFCDAVDEGDRRVHEVFAAAAGFRIAPTRKLNITVGQSIEAANSGKAALKSVSSDSKIPPARMCGQAV